MILKREGVVKIVCMRNTYTYAIVALVVILIIVTAYFTYQAMSMKAALINLEGEYNSLMSNYVSLRGNYTRLEGMYDELMSNYTQLRSAYDQLLQGFSANFTYKGREIGITYVANATQVGMINQLISTGLGFGNPSAKVVLIEFMDPTCPFCAEFGVEYGNYLNDLISKGAVYYVVQYFPTHVLSYYPTDNETFMDGVEDWIGLRCVYYEYGPGSALSLIHEFDQINYLYNTKYSETGNTTYYLLYPVLEYEFLARNYPNCAFNYSMTYLMNYVNNALNNMTMVQGIMNIPSSLMGTPLFIIYNRVNHVVYIMAGATQCPLMAINYTLGICT